MLQALEAHPPDVVVLVRRDMREYGVEALGRGYGARLMQWVASRYRIVRTFEDPELISVDMTQAVVMRRAGPP